MKPVHPPPRRGWPVSSHMQILANSAVLRRSVAALREKNVVTDACQERKFTRAPLGA